MENTTEHSPARHDALVRYHRADREARQHHRLANDGIAVVTNRRKMHAALDRRAAAEADLRRIGA